MRQFIVIVYTVLILASLPWARQIWDLAGDRNGFFILIGLYAGSIICVRNIWLMGLLAVAAVLVFKLIPLPVERVHFVEYGVLGWLSYRAFGKKAVIYVIFIGIIDELIQGVLPDRFFDLRDIFMNITGGGIGIVMRQYASR